MYYAKFGKIELKQLLSFNDFSRTRAASYAETATVGGKPVLQRTGDELDMASFSVRLHRSFCDPLVTIKDFEAYRKSGEIVTLYWGNGELGGDYIVKSVTEDSQMLHSDGSIWECTISVSLVEGVAVQKKTTGFALTTLAPRTYPISVTPRIPAAAVVKNATAAASSANEARGRFKRIQQLEANSANALAAYRKAKQVVVRLNKSVSDIAAQGKNVTTLLSAIERIGVSLANGDINSALASLTEVENRVLHELKPSLMGDMQSIINRIP